MKSFAPLRALGPEHCPCGTNGPCGRTDAWIRYDGGLIKRRIARLFPDRSVQDKILGDNFRALIGGTA